MWAAFLHLIQRAVLNTINEKGTTLLAFGLGLFVSMVQLGAQMWGQRKQGKSAITARLRDWKSYIGVALCSLPQSGLKIRRPQGRGCSSPPPGTTISGILPNH
jgi:hypothetical protein